MEANTPESADSVGTVPPIGVRAAQLSDLDELTRLDAATRRSLSAARGGEIYFLRNARVEPVRDSYARDIADPTCLVLMGLIGSSPVGFAVASAVQLAGGYRLADIGEIFVEEAAREVGVGEALMEAIIEWARSQGCHGLDSRALPGDRGTKNFFESNGLVARAILVHRDLRDT